MPNGTYGGVRGERISPLLDFCNIAVFRKINELVSVGVEGNISVRICSEKRYAELIEIAYHLSVGMTVFVVQTAGSNGVHRHYKVNEILCGGGG